METCPSSGDSTLRYRRLLSALFLNPSRWLRAAEIMCWIGLRSEPWSGQAGRVGSGQAWPGLAQTTGDARFGLAVSFGSVRFLQLHTSSDIPNLGEMNTLAGCKRVIYEMHHMKYINHSVMMILTLLAVCVLRPCVINLSFS